MPDYLTKEEIRQWRSSLEKITLEEFAARLGKEVEENKPTDDLADMIMSKGTSVGAKKNVQDGFSKIAQRAFERERQIAHTPFSIGKRKEPKQNNTAVSENKPDISQKESTAAKEAETSVKKDSQIVLSKTLTDREQVVFDYLLGHAGETVSAKDLAELLDLPRDYVYKYIKNIRTKIEGGKLENVPSGGFVLTV